MNLVAPYRPDRTASSRLLLSLILLQCLSLAATRSSAQTPNTWETLPGPYGGAVVGICLDRSNPALLLIATRGGGCFRSTDAGERWAAASEGLASLRTLCITTKRGGRPEVFVSLEAPFGIWRTTDDGVSWSKQSNGIPSQAAVTDIAYSVESPDVLYAASNAGLFASTDGGANWAQRNTTAARTVLPLAGNRVLLGTATGEILRSTDGGGNFSAVSGVGGSAVNELEQDPLSPFNVYAATTRGLRKSTDGGASWAELTALRNTVVRAIAVQPLGEVFAATGGSGIHRSSDGGETWEAVNTGLGSGTFNDIVILGGAAPRWYAASEDGAGFHVSAAGDGSWSERANGLLAAGITAAASTINALYVASSGSGIAKSTDRGNTWTPASGGLSRSLLVTALVPDPANPSALYAATADGVYKTVSAAGGDAAWAARRSGIAPGPVSSVAVDPLRPQTLYAGVVGNGLYRSTDGGDSWTALGGGIPRNASIPAIATSRTTPGSVHVAVKGSDPRDDGVYLSTNGGDGWIRRGGLPEDAELRILLSDTRDDAKLYAGTTAGVYVSGNGGGDWLEASGPVRDGTVRSIVAHAGSTGYLFAGTTTGLFRSTDAGGSWVEFPTGGALPAVNILAFDGGSPAVLFAGTNGAGLLRNALSPVIDTDAEPRFAETRIGSTVSVDWALRNAGLLPMNVRELRLAGPHATQFRIEGQSGNITVSAGATHIATLMFAPTSEGEKGAELRVSADAPGGDPLVVPLRATATAPRLSSLLASLDFGDVPVGASHDSTFTITNTGTAELVIAREFIDGTDAPHFSIVTAPPARLRPKETAQVTLRFVPTSTGRKSAEYRIESDAFNTPVTVIPLGGTGGDEAGLHVEPLAIDFGAIVVNSTRDSSVTLRNEGSLSLDITEQKLEGTHADDFLLVREARTPLESGGETEVVLRFQPRSDGSRSAGLRIRSTAANSPDVLVTLTGSGGSAPAIAVAPASLDFGSTDPGTPVELGLAVTNTGTATLEITNIKPEGDGVFTVAPWPSAIAPGATDTVRVRYLPAGNGEHGGTLVIESNAVNAQRLTVALRGSTRGRPLITASTALLAFGVIEFGSFSELTLRVGNAGTARLQLGTPVIDGADAADFRFERTGPDALDPGEEGELLVRFTPTANGPRSARLLLLSNDPEPARDTLFVALEGEGLRDETAPVITHQAPMAAVPPGEDVPLSASAADAGSGLRRLELWYRSGAQAWSEERRIEITDGEAVIPGPFVTGEGVDYRIIATDNVGNADTARNGILTHFSLPVAVNGEELGGVAVTEGSTAAAYHIVSFPLERTDGSIAPLFAPMGVYNPRLWRLYGLERGAFREQYEDLVTSREAETGAAYFLISRYPAFLPNAAGTTVPTTEGMAGDGTRIGGWDLDAGWNLVGNPYGFDIGRSALRFEDGSPVVEMWAYDGAWRPADTLPVFGGVAIYAPAPGKLRLSENESGGFSFAPRTIALPEKRAAGSRTAWALRLRLDGAQGGDHENSLGVHPEAMMGIDSFDRHEPPRIPGGVSLAFIPPDGEGNAQLASDIRPDDGEGSEWRCIIQSDDAEAITLKVEGRHLLPAGYGVLCVDESGGGVYAMRADSVLELAVHPGRRSLRFTVGTEEFLRSRTGMAEAAPVPVADLSVYPNPATGPATLRFRLREAGTVTIVVHDALGRRVREMALGPLGEGWHEHLVEKSGLIPGMNPIEMRLELGHGSHKSIWTRLILRGDP